SLALLALVALLTACTTGSNPTTPSPDPTPGGDEPPVGADAVYFVHGSGLGDATEQVVALFHTDDGVIDPTRPVEDAAVTLNGAVLAYDAARQRYVGSLPAALDPGAEVQLTIEVGEQRIEASGRGPQVATFPRGSGRAVLDRARPPAGLRRSSTNRSPRRTGGAK